MVQQLRYARSGKKHRARAETIGRFRSSLVGTRLQYWTLAGPCARHGEVLKGSEYDWAISSGLITPAQWHGVDLDPVVAKRNAALPEGHWYCADFYETILAAVAADSFRPGLINYDSTSMPKAGLPYLADLFYLVQAKKNCVVVANFITHLRHHSVDGTRLLEQLREQPGARYLFVSNTPWKIHTQVYVYQGSERHQRTAMTSLVFWSGLK